MDAETSKVQIDRASPMAGILSGGMTATITGLGFQEGTVAYFGSQASEKTIVESNSTIKAVVPALDKSGTVAVTVVNPDGGQAVQIVGFTYVTPVNDDRAEVLGVSPLTVIEEVQTEITLHGRNLIEAYEKGLVALRAPNRINLEILGVTATGADESGIEALTFKVFILAGVCD